MFDCLVYCRVVSSGRVHVFDCLVYCRGVSNGRVNVFVRFTVDG